MDLGLGIAREPGETWRACAARYGKKWGLEAEVLAAFDADVAAGTSERDAAWGACQEWDVCEIWESK